MVHLAAGHHEQIAAGQGGSQLKHIFEVSHLMVVFRLTGKFY